MRFWQLYGILGEKGCRSKAVKPADELMEPATPLQAAGHQACMRCKHRDIGSKWYRALGNPIPENVKNQKAFMRP